MLIHPPADHPVLVQQLLPQVCIKVEQLRVNRVGEYMSRAVLLPQKLAQLVRIVRSKQVPDRAAWLAIVAGRSV